MERKSFLGIGYKCSIIDHKNGTFLRDITLGVDVPIPRYINNCLEFHNHEKKSHRREY